MEQLQNMFKKSELEQVANTIDPREYLAVEKFAVKKCATKNLELLLLPIQFIFVSNHENDNVSSFRQDWWQWLNLVAMHNSREVYYTAVYESKKFLGRFLTIIVKPGWRIVTVNFAPYELADEEFLDKITEVFRRGMYGYNWEWVERDINEWNNEFWWRIPDRRFFVIGLAPEEITKEEIDIIPRVFRCSHCGNIYDAKKVDRCLIYDSTIVCKKCYYEYYGHCIECRDNYPLDFIKNADERGVGICKFCLE